MRTAHIEGGLWEVYVDTKHWYTVSFETEPPTVMTKDLRPVSPTGKLGKELIEVTKKRHLRRIANKG